MVNETPIPLQYSWQIPALPRLVLIFQRYEGVLFPTIVFVILRVLTLVGAVLMISNQPAHLPPWLFYNPSGQTYAQGLPHASPLVWLVEPWYRYDTIWYVRNAMLGYHPGELGRVFPPLYSLFIRQAVPICGGNYVLSSLLISSLAGLATFILLYNLTRREFSSASLARRTVLTLAVFPTAFFFMAGYSESLFMALILGALLAGFKRYWLLAGILSALAALTRLQGALLCLPLAWIAYIHLRKPGLRAFAARIPAVIGGIVGAGAYFVYAQMNNLGGFDKAYASEWRIHNGPPWVAIRIYIERLIGGQTLGFENDNAVALLFIALVGIVVAVKLRPLYGLYLWPTLVLLLTRYHDGPQFEGMFRYVLVMFPCFFIVAMLVKRRWMLALYVIVAFSWQLILLDRFVHWIWVA